MRIVLVEDNLFQEEAIRNAITAAFPGVGVDTIWTELEFRNKLEELVESPPDLVILDVMLPWTEAGPEVDDSPLEYDDRLAGLRCRVLLKERAPHVPVVLYSILDTDDIGEQAPQDVCFIQKKSSFEKLLQQIGKKLNAPRRDDG
jgi:DNA-binding NarL/FixJ family response regulator